MFLVADSSSQGPAAHTSEVTLSFQSSRYLASLEPSQGQVVHIFTFVHAQIFVSAVFADDP